MFWINEQGERRQADAEGLKGGDFVDFGPSRL
jgi:hypothetical protein